MGKSESYHYNSLKVIGIKIKLKTSIKSLEETQKEISVHVETIKRAKGSAEISNLSSYENSLNSISSDTIKDINDLIKRIDTIKREIEEFDQPNELERVGYTFLLTGSKLFEGFLGVGEGLVDGLASIVAWAGSKFGADTSALQTFVEYDFFGTLGHKFNEATGASKYSYFSEDSTAANVIEGFGTMLGYTALGAVSGGIVGDLATGYIADLGMTTQAYMKEYDGDDKFNKAFAAGTKEGIKGAAFTVVLGGLARSFSKAGKEALGTIDDIGVKGLGTVDDLDDSVKSMQKSVSGIDAKTGKLGDIGKIEPDDIKAITEIDGKNVKIEPNSAKGSAKTTKTGTRIEKYDITDAADGSKKLGEIEVVTKKDGSVIKTTKTLDDTGKTSKVTIEKATNTSGNYKTKEIITKDYSSGHKRADVTTTIKETGEGSFTKTTQEGKIRNKVTSTEKITVSTDSSGVPKEIKTETFDGKLKRNGTSKKHTNKVSNTTETLDPAGNVQQRVSETLDSKGNVISKTTDDIAAKATGNGETISRTVENGSSKFSYDIETTRASSGDLEEIKTNRVEVDASGNKKTLKETVELYEDDYVKKRSITEFDDAGSPAKTTTDEMTIKGSSINKKNVINSETIKRTVTEGGNTEASTYTRTTNSKGKTIKAEKVVETDVDGVTTTVKTSANGKGVINTKKTTVVDSGGATVKDEIETVNRQGFKRKVSETNGKKVTTVELDNGTSSKNRFSVARSQTSTIGQKHIHSINDSYITGNKINKAVAKIDDMTSNFSEGFKSYGNAVYDDLAKNKLTKWTTNLYDKASKMIKENSNMSRAVRAAGLVGTQVTGAWMNGGYTDTPVAIGNKDHSNSNISSQDSSNNNNNSSQDYSNNNNNNSSQDSSNNDNNTTQNRENHSTSGYSDSNTYVTSPPTSSPNPTTPPTTPDTTTPPTTPGPTTPPTSSPNPTTPPTSSEVITTGPPSYDDLEILDDNLEEPIDDSDLLEEGELNEDDVDSYTIPTPTTENEIDKNDKNSNVGPILTGLGLAGAAGVGAKIYLDKKKNNELENEDDEEDELIADEWKEDDDNFDFMNDDSSPINYQDQES